MLGIKWLSECDGNRQNNFTLIRLLFAWAVLFGHSFPITATGSDPVSTLMLPHLWIGEIAVNGFFAISGYLVCASFARRGAVEFLSSRILRIYPGIIVYVLVATFVIGPLATNLPWKTYFASPQSWAHLWTATLWENKFNLPGVFADRPFAGSLNGSLWTLPAEIRCYLLIFVAGFFGAFDKKHRANALLVGLLLTNYFDSTQVPLLGTSPRFQIPTLFFILGALAWVNRAHIPLAPWLVFPMAIVPWLLTGTSYFNNVFAISLVYTILFAAFRLPHVDLDRFGDISYGMYIYAWPIQQLVWRQDQSAYVNAVISTLIVIPLAYASWLFVEKPSLRLKSKVAVIYRTSTASISKELQDPTTAISA
jgi:peptidoglycan/LPS O-acetylase OafA/YrhL